MIVDFEKQFFENPYLLLDNVSKIFGFKKVKNGYVSLFHKGEFDNLFDYNRGMYWVHLLAQGRNDNIYVSFYIGNIDDSAWVAYSKRMTLEKCNNIIENIYKEFESNKCCSLPTEETLNKILNTYGLHGTYTD